MAKTVVALEASFDSSQAEGSVKSLRSQLKEAQADVAAMADKFGETSKQAIEAAKRAAELKDKIGDAKALTDSFNPDRKFQAFSSALSGVAGGFAAVQGAMGLFGAESKDLEKTLLKVQSAMAISQGLSTVTESIDAFKNLKAVVMSFNVVQKIVTAAQWVWNAAMDANPIGAIVLAITALIAGISALVDWLETSSEAEAQQTAEIEKNQQALEDQRRAYELNSEALQKNQDYKLKLLKASGASSQAIRDNENSLIDEKIAFEKNSLEAAKNAEIKNRLYVDTLKAQGASDEMIGKAAGVWLDSSIAVNEATVSYGKALLEKEDLTKKHNVDELAEATQANEKALELAAQMAADIIKKGEELNQKILEGNKKLNAQKRALEEEFALLAIKDEDERAKKKLEFEFIRAKEEIQNTIASRSVKQQAINDLEIKFQNDKDAIDKERAKKNLDNQLAQDKATDELILRNRIQAIKDSFDKQQFEIEVQRQKEIDTQLDLLNKKLINEDQYNQNLSLINQNYNQQQQDATEAHNKELEEKDKKHKKELLDNEQALAEGKKNIQDATINNIEAGIKLLQTLGGKNKAIQKAALIAESAVGIAKIVINTKTANAVAKASPINAVDPTYGTRMSLLNNISAAIGIAANIAATAKALQNLGGGGGAGGGTGGGNETTAPVTPQAATTTLNQGQVNQLASATSRAFVLESDVSGNQERIQRLNRAARIS